MSAYASSFIPAPAASEPISVPLVARWLCLIVLAIGCFSGPLDIAEGTGGENAARVAKAPSLLLKLANAERGRRDRHLGCALRASSPPVSHLDTRAAAVHHCVDLSAVMHYVD